jgi:hypothetical protein
VAATLVATPEPAGDARPHDQQRGIDQQPFIDQK